ncbi:hypothetical protein GCM10009559_06730 [Pseudonocardia zijingensis]|uniref:Uncharacterized protein n=1 Tax=Pseudonocardia zijingensis TaxID=153376 RepID=A0ABP3ZMK7_9PSEU
MRPFSGGGAGSSARAGVAPASSTDMDATATAAASAASRLTSAPVDTFRTDLTLLFPPRVGLAGADALPGG